MGKGEGQGKAWDGPRTSRARVPFRVFRVLRVFQVFRVFRVAARTDLELDARQREDAGEEPDTAIGCRRGETNKRDVVSGCGVDERFGSGRDGPIDG